MHLTWRYRGFKGLKQAIKLEFKLGRYSDVSPRRLSHIDMSDWFQGYRTLPGTPHLRQVRCDTELFGKIDQQHARLHREGLR